MKTRSQGLLPGVLLEAIMVHADGTREPPRLVAANSWHKQIIFILEACLGNRNVGSVPRAADGTGRTVSPSDTPDTGMFSILVAENSTPGIVVGSGTGALVATDSALGTKINAGTGGGQLSYKTLTQSTVPAAITGGYRISIERQFVNDSGGTITINEVGVEADSNTTDQANSEAFLILRDLVVPAITVLDTQAVIFRYHIDFL